MDKNFSLSEHLRALQAKQKEEEKEHVRSAKRKREEWIRAGAPSAEEYAVMLEEKERKQKQLLEKEQRLIAKREKKANKELKKKKKLEKKIQKMHKASQPAEDKPVRLSKWKKKSTDKSTDSETDNEEENNTEDINQTKKNKKKKKKRKQSDGEEEEEESDNLSDIDWGRPPPADYNASALLEAEKDMNKTNVATNSRGVTNLIPSTNINHHLVVPNLVYVPLMPPMVNLSFPPLGILPLPFLAPNQPNCILPFPFPHPLLRTNVTMPPLKNESSNRVTQPTPTMLSKVQAAKALAASLTNDPHSGS